jgi:hypothetical protein
MHVQAGAGRILNVRQKAFGVCVEIIRNHAVAELMVVAGLAPS